MSDVLNRTSRIAFAPKRSTSWTMRSRGLLTRFGEHFCVFVQFATYEVSEVGEDLLSNMVCANRSATHQAQRLRDPLSNDRRESYIEHRFDSPETRSGLR